jgi:hypothetical protein
VGDDEGRKRILEMVADLAREAGILVLVFGFMDAAIGEVRNVSQAAFLTFVPLLALVLIGGGIVLERVRPIR